MLSFGGEGPILAQTCRERKPRSLPCVSSLPALRGFAPGPVKGPGVSFVQVSGLSACHVAVRCRDDDSHQGAQHGADAESKRGIDQVRHATRLVQRAMLGDDPKGCADDEAGPEKEGVGVGHG